MNTKKMLWELQKLGVRSLSVTGLRVGIHRYHQQGQ